MAIAHHENHANMIESRCVRYREQRDAAQRESDLCENLARDANRLAQMRYDQSRDIGNRYVAVQDESLELRALHLARGEASAGHGRQETKVYARLSSELEHARLSEFQLERACYREQQDCRFQENTFSRCESLLQRRTYELTETELELRNTEETWMRMRRETDAMLRLEAQMQSTLATEHAKYLEAEALVSRLRHSEH